MQKATMAHGWNGGTSLAIRLKNNSNLGLVKERQQEATASNPCCHRKCDHGETFAK
jgi:hypothetical protein